MIKTVSKSWFPLSIFGEKNTFQGPSAVFVNIALWWKGAMCVKTEAFQQICQGL